MKTQKHVPEGSRVYNGTDSFVYSARVRATEMFLRPHKNIMKQEPRYTYVALLTSVFLKLF